MSIEPEESKKMQRTQFSEKSRRERIEKLRQTLGLRLPSYNIAGIEAESLGGNVENYLGTIQIPVGLAGPLLIKFNNKSEKIFAPIATNEGALVSSITRGALALSLSGGVTARMISNRMIRAPFFQFSDLDQALKFSKWVTTQFVILQGLLKNRSSYARLIEIDPKFVGRSVHLRFSFTTEEAAGQNMTTFCTSYLCSWLAQQWEVEGLGDRPNYFIEGNLASDKKVSQIAMSEGRGRSVVAEAVVKASVLRRVLKIQSSQDLVNQFHQCKSAQIYSGMSGFNINLANVVSGIFLATGQDFACVHESSVGELHMEPQGDDLYISLSMPCLIVGTIGGGTGLPSARDNLAILGCHELSGSADRLAEIVASFAMGLELSTLSAVSGGQFVEAHKKHGRDAGLGLFRFSDLSLDFFNQSVLKKNNEKIVRIEKLPTQNKQGYTSDFALQLSKKLIGLMAFNLQSQGTNNEPTQRKVFLKIKPHSNDIILGASRVLEMMNPALADLILKNRDLLPFQDSHLREIKTLSAQDEVIKKYAPEYLGSYEDVDKEIFVLIQELLEDTTLMSEVENLDLWTPTHKKQVIEAIHELHEKYKGKIEQARKKFPTILEPYKVTSSENLERESFLWTSFYQHIRPRIENLDSNVLDTRYMLSFYRKSVDGFSEWMTEISQLPLTVIHFDFNSRNIAFKNEKPIIFDWEFLALGPAARDLIEFTIFTSTPETVVRDFSVILQDHPITGIAWEKAGELCLRDFITRRLPFYFVLNEIGSCSYYNRLLLNISTLVRELYGKDC